MAKIDTSVRPFSGKDEWGYIFGDMAGSFVNLYVDAYFTLMIFSVFLCISKNFF